MDLETTGTHITKDRVCELAAVHAHSDSRMNCESFATTIQLDANIVIELEAFKVHGITNEEIQQSPSFEEVWYRFEKWIMDVMNSTTKYNEADSDDNDTGLPTLLESPCVVLVAHNWNKI